MYVQKALVHTVCVCWPWTHEPSPIQTHWSIHVTLFLFYIFVRTLSLLYPERCSFFQAAISPASPGKQSRAWGWAPATSLLAVIVHNAVPTSAVILLFPTWGKLLKRQPWCSRLKLLRYRHIFYLQMLAENDHINHTLTHTLYKLKQNLRNWRGIHTQNHTESRTMVFVRCIRQEVSSPSQSCFCQTKGLLLHS